MRDRYERDRDRYYNDRDRSRDRRRVSERGLRDDRDRYYRRLKFKFRFFIRLKFKDRLFRVFVDFRVKIDKVKLREIVM